MSENPPQTPQRSERPQAARRTTEAQRSLSPLQQRSIVRNYAKYSRFHERALKALTDAKDAYERAKYVEQGEIERITLGTRGGKYDEAVYKAAPIEESLEAPDKGGKRRKAARRFSRTHDLSERLKKEVKRLENLAEQTKHLEEGMFTRTLFGGRGKKYDTLHEGDASEEELHKALARLEKKIEFRSPTTKTIEVTPVKIDIPEETPETAEETLETVEEPALDTIVEEELPVDDPNQTEESSLDSLERRVANQERSLFRGGALEQNLFMAEAARQERQFVQRLSAEQKEFNDRQPKGWGKRALRYIGRLARALTALGVTMAGGWYALEQKAEEGRRPVEITSPVGSTDNPHTPFSRTVENTSSPDTSMPVQEASYSPTDN